MPLALATGIFISITEWHWHLVNAPSKSRVRENNRHGSVDVFMSMKLNLGVRDMSTTRQKMVDLLEALHKVNLALWVENGKLKFSSPSEETFKQYRKQILSNKFKIIELLLLNKVFTPFDFNQKRILKFKTQGNMPLSFAQERLWFIEQYEQGTNAYHIPIVLELEDTIDLHILEESLQYLVERHQVLRTVFKHDEQGNACQKILNAPLTISHKLPLSNHAFRDSLKQEINQVFNLKEEYHIRAIVYAVTKEKSSKTKIGDEEKTSEQKKQAVNYYVLINVHHAAFDGWSMDILLKELDQIYDALLQNTLPKLPSLSIQYKDFAYWHRVYLQGKVLNQQINYWKERLLYTEPLVFPTDYPRPKKINYKGQYMIFNIDNDISTKLKALAKERGYTLYTILLSGFYILLHKYTGQDNLVIGTPIANRPYSQLENLVGFFVNSLAISYTIKGEQSTESLISTLHRSLVEAQSHQDIPFEKLVDALDIETDQSRHPIFQIMFGMQPFGKQVSPYFKVEKSEESYQTAKFDLSLFFSDQGETIRTSLNYATSLFKIETMNRFAKHYQHILKQLTEPNNKKIKEYQLLTPTEYKQIVYTWNKTDMTYPKNRTIHQLFQKQAEETPDNIALVFKNQKLSYKDLNQKSNQLARYIRKQYQNETKEALKQDTLITLCLDRSLEMIIGILGILKAGGAYVPISPNYPNKRIKYLLSDTKNIIILTQTQLTEKLGNILKTQKVITLDDEPYINENTNNLSSYSNATNLAYVIYTSGTTGVPKGTMLNHQSVINYWFNVKTYFEDIRSIDFSSNLSFDLSVTTTVVPLLSGKKIVIYPGELNDFNAYISHLKSNAIDFIKSTPSYLAQLAFESGGVNIRRCFVGGEKLEHRHVKDISNYIENIHDEYGPTEATVGTTNILKTPHSQTISSIGKAYLNYKTYVLDQYHHPTPIGVVGELYIGGAGLARGYLNQLELTKEKFIANPFSTESDRKNGYNKLYKTGDLVRWLPDGNIEYIGRNDFQVKVRGFRIELAEIEKTLSKHPDVKQVEVLAKEKVNKSKEIHQYLVVYYVSNKSISEDALIKHVSQSLPDYMLPRTFIRVKSFPLTINGKLDRNALPEPVLGVEEKIYVAPQTQLEKQLAKIWSEILGVKQIGINSSFFHLGGSSLQIMKLTTLLKQKLDLTISVTQAYQYPTIKQFTKLIADGESENKQVVFSQEAILDPLIHIRKQTHTINSAICQEKGQITILLTGATGFVGCYLLHELLTSTNALIYCLVRSNSDQQAIQRLKDGLKKYKLWNEVYTKRITPILGELSKARLGISKEQYRCLSNTIDVVVHSASYMDHFHTYFQLKPINVKGTEEILRFTCAGKKKKSIHFISTINVFGGGKQHTVNDESTPLDSQIHYQREGYSASKWIADCLCQKAMKRNINCNVYRLGLIIPSHNTFISPSKQWFVNLLVACITLYKFPLILSKLQMPIMCVDDVARSIVTIIKNFEGKNTNFHLWQQTPLKMKDIAYQLREKFNCELVPMKTWIADYEQYQIDHSDSLPVLPALEKIKIDIETYKFENDTKLWQHLKKNGRAIEEIKSYKSEKTKDQLKELGLSLKKVDEYYIRNLLENL